MFVICEANDNLNINAMYVRAYKWKSYVWAKGQSAWTATVNTALTALLPLLRLKYLLSHA